MFFAIVLIIIGTLFLLQALGMGIGHLTTLVWAVILLAVGFKMLAKKNACPVCGWKHLGCKMHKKMHDHMNDECCSSGGCCEEDEEENG